MFDRCIYFNLNALTRDLNRIWDEEFRALGLSPAHAYLLRAVLANPGINQKALADELSLAPSTVTRFVDALAARQLLERRPAADNAREIALHPTRAGKRLLAALEESGQALYDRLRRKLGARRFDAFVRELRDIREQLDPSD